MSKAPDKIYLPKEEIEERKPWIEASDEDNPGWDECYIRKDALLKWAKFVLKCQEEELAKYDGPSYMKSSIMGRIDAYKVLIAKLNSL